jgi:hypothetical protein
MVFLGRNLNSPPSGSKQLTPIPAEISINIGISFADIFVRKTCADIFVQEAA